jgi:hypothetical protein
MCAVWCRSDDSDAGSNAGRCTRGGVGARNENPGDKTMGKNVTCRVALDAKKDAPQREK